MREPHEAIDKVRSTFAQLDRDRDRLHTHYFPAAGSPLDLDDQFSPRPVMLSQHVWSLLGACHDHLDCVRLSIDQKRGFVSATSSLVRGAMLAATHATWLLAHDDAELRRNRLIRFSDQWLHQRIDWQTNVEKQVRHPNDLIRLRGQVNLMTEDKAELAKLRTRRPDPNIGMRPTEVVEEAASHVFSDPGHRLDYSNEWARLSGDAHALGWTLMLGDIDWGPDVADGPRETRIFGSPEKLANAYLGTWMVYRHAWKRLDELGETQPPTTSPT